MHRLPLMLWVFLSISVFVLTSKGSAAVDLGDDWELAGAAYRQNYSSLPALAYARNTVRLEDRTAPRSEPKDLPQEQTATIWDEEERLVVSGENRYREVITVHWRSRVDGVFTSLSERLHLSREPCLPQGMHLGVGWKDSRRLASEWTVRRVLGKQLGSLTLSLQDLIEQPPSSMEIDDVGGVQCIKACYADVSGDVGNGSGSLYNIMIWMTFAPHSIPRRIRVDSPTGSWNQIEVLETMELSGGVLGPVTVPIRARMDQKLSSDEIEFSDFSVSEKFADTVFVPPIRPGARVIDDTKGSRQVSYVGGDEGQRAYFKTHGLSDAFIRAKVDKDPAAAAELIALASVNQAVPANLQGPSSETGISVSTLFLIAAGLLGAATYWQWSRS